MNTIIHHVSVCELAGLVDRVFDWLTVKLPEKKLLRLSSHEQLNASSCTADTLKCSYCSLVVFPGLLLAATPNPAPHPGPFLMLTPSSCPFTFSSAFQPQKPHCFSDRHTFMCVTIYLLRHWWNSRSVGVVQMPSFALYTPSMPFHCRLWPLCL